MDGCLRQQNIHKINQRPVQGPGQGGSEARTATAGRNRIPDPGHRGRAAGLPGPGGFKRAAPAVPYLLGVIMFCMGLTMTPQDFTGVVKRPWAVALGLVAHYVIMPGLGG